MAHVPVTFYTAAHRIVGKVALRERLSEALNDPLTDYLEVHEPQVSKLIDPTHTTVEWKVAALPKKKVLIATMDLESHESAVTRQDKTTSKSGTSVGALIGSIEIYGTAHLTVNGGPVYILRDALSVFFPVTDAALLLSATGDSRVDTRLAMVNRAHVSTFTML